MSYMAFRETVDRRRQPPNLRYIYFLYSPNERKKNAKMKLLYIIILKEIGPFFYFDCFFLKKHLQADYTQFSDIIQAILF